MKFVPIVLAAVFLLSACVKDKPQPLVTEVVSGQTQARVLITCEGNFGSGNAALSLYDKQSGAVVTDWYQQQNAATCGDVLQSLNKWHENYYLIVNNSAKIIVCDATLKKTGEIKGLSSPRYFLPVTNNKAYVSDLKANAIQVVDLNTNRVSSSIVCAGWTERMQMIYNRVFVTNISSKYVYVINTLNDKMEDSVLVGNGAASLALDNHDKLWVLSAGKFNSTESAQLIQIDPVSLKITATINLGSDAVSNLCANSAGDRLYFLQGGVNVMDVQSQVRSKLIEVKNSNFYGMTIDPKTGEIYVADAMDYSQASTVYVFASNGTKLSTFKAGVNANGFYFE